MTIATLPMENEVLLVILDCESGKKIREKNQCS